ncbi:hypothetical protein BvCmsOUNP003_05041 [Escherichia coli]|nr:hypothetical protein BvCmsOUNP003_05041 [Escherichia coli]
MVRDGPPLIPGTIILSSPVSSSRSAFRTGTNGKRPVAPVLKNLMTGRPLSITIAPRTGMCSIRENSDICISSARRRALTANNASTSRPGTLSLFFPASFGHNPATVTEALRVIGFTAISDFTALSIRVAIFPAISATGIHAPLPATDNCIPCGATPITKAPAANMLLSAFFTISGV